MPEDPSQRRRFPRYHTDLEVTISHGADSIRTRIKQISRGGCLVFPPLDLWQSTEVRIVFRLADDLPEVRCKGEIMYSVSAQGSGIAFTEIAPRNLDLITEHFEKAASSGAPAAT